MTKYHTHSRISKRLIIEEMSPRNNNLKVSFKLENVDNECVEVDYSEDVKKCGCGNKLNTTISICSECRRKRCGGVRC